MKPARYFISYLIYTPTMQRGAGWVDITLYKPITDGIFLTEVGEKILEGAKAENAEITGITIISWQRFEEILTNPWWMFWR